MSARFLNYGRQYVDDDDIAAVVDVLRSDYLTQGPAVEAFEAALAERVGARFAVAVSSGTAALHVACLAAGIKPGKRGVTSSLTFIASANALIYSGGEATALDIDGYSLSLTPAALKTALDNGPDIAAVIPVHYAGLACDSAEIAALARGRALVIEDASHALGSTYTDGKFVGSGAHADMTVFSFHPVKPITTGEGGAITTNDETLYRRLKLYANHGIERRPDHFEDHAAAYEGSELNPWYYEQQALGYNYRLSDIHAALGRAQMVKLDNFIARRRAIAAAYDAAFASLEEIGRPQSKPSDRARSAHHIYPVTIDFASLGTTRGRFMKRLATFGVGAQVHYIPLHRQPFQVKRYGYKPVSFPATEDYFQTCLTLPLHAGIGESEVERVVEAVCSTIAMREAA